MRDLTLISPAGLPDAQRFRQQAQAAGRPLIGASSLAFDPEASGYDDWAMLPYVHNPILPRLCVTSCATVPSLPFTPRTA